MMNYKLRASIFSILVLTSIACNAQLTQATHSTYYSYSQVEYTYGPYYFSETMGFVKGLLKEKQEKERRKEYKELMQGKTKEMKDYYSSLKGSYPSSIKNGWHQVVLISGNRYMDERKVLVKNNQITKVVWDNWMPEEIAFGGLIKDAKSALSFKNANENLSGLVEVYFMNAIGNLESLAQTPLEPSKLVFWTRKSAYKNWKINVNGNLFGPFVIKHRKGDVIDCDNFEELIVYAKPGVVEYGRGSSYSSRPIGQKGRFQVKEGECKVIEIKK